MRQGGRTNVTQVMGAIGGCPIDLFDTARYDAVTVNHLAVAASSYAGRCLNHFRNNSDIVWRSLASGARSVDAVEHGTSRSAMICLSRRHVGVPCARRRRPR